MPRMHILESGGTNTYSVVVHAPTPVGNNAANVAWSVALQNSGNAISMLPVGNGPGQISNSENNQVVAGTIMETAFAWEDDPNWTNPQRLADLDIRAAQAVAQAVADYQARLKFFGYTVA